LFALGVITGRKWPGRLYGARPRGRQKKPLPLVEEEPARAEPVAAAPVAVVETCTVGDASPPIAEGPALPTPSADAPRDLTERLPGQHFPLGTIYYAMELVRSGVSLRGAARILAWLAPALGLEGGAPCYQTVRQWTLRFGLYELTCPRPASDDWVWMVDHTQQQGDKKVLLIVGLRLSEWAADRPLEQRDLELLALHPETHATGESLDQHLEELSQRMGIPRAIVSDGASDLRLGVALFRARHPEHTVAWLYDIKHFTAVLLKRELEHDPTWKAFTAAANRTKQQCSVTALAALNPPNQRGKARYLNLQELVAWGHKMLLLLDHPNGPEQLGLDPDKCAARLGWLREYRAAIDEWRAALEVVEITESQVRRHGVSRDVVETLRPKLEAAATSPLSQRLRDQLLIHLAEQAEQTTPDQPLPASSEVLESLIGSYKYLQGEQSHQGITSVVLGLGTLIADNLLHAIPAAFEAVKTKTVVDWCQEQLGPTLQSCRQRLQNLLSPRKNPDPQPATT
jgi:hypothetical protein